MILVIHTAQHNQHNPNNQDLVGTYESEPITEEEMQAELSTAVLVTLESRTITSAGSPRNNLISSASFVLLLAKANTIKK